PTNEIDSVFPRAGSPRHRIWYKRLSLNRTRSRRGPFVSDLIIQLSRSFGEIRGVSRWDIFLEAIQALHNHSEISLPPLKGIAKFVEIETLRHGNEQMMLERYA